MFHVVSVSLFVVGFFVFVLPGVQGLCVWIFGCFCFCFCLPHHLCVASPPRATLYVRTVHMADTGRSSHALGISVAVAVFLFLERLDLVPRTQVSRQRHVSP